MYFVVSALLISSIVLVRSSKMNIQTLNLVVVYNGVTLTMLRYLISPLCEGRGLFGRLEIHLNTVIAPYGVWLTVTGL